MMKKYFLQISTKNTLPFIFLLLSVIFFSPFLFKGKVFIAADTLYSFFPWKAYVDQNYRPHNTLITDPVNGLYDGIYNQQLKKGRLANWNPSILTGIPNAFGPLSGYPGRYYPFKYLFHKISPPHIGLNIFLFIHVFLMGMFMYLYLKEIGLEWEGALFGGIAYMFNGHAMVWLEFQNVVAISAYFPLLLFIMEKLQKEKREKQFIYAFGGMLIFGMIPILGNLQYTIYVVLFVLFYLLFILAKSYREKQNLRNILLILACFTIVIGGGLLVACIELIPLRELISLSSRINRTFTFTNFFKTLARVPFRYLITLFSPDYFGNPTMGFNLIPRLPTQEYMNYNELCLYIGIPTLFSFLAFLIQRKNRHGFFYLFMTALTLAMITGTYVYYPFFKLFPGMNKTNPTRLIFLFVFSISVASAFGFESLKQFSIRKKKIFLILLIISMILIIIFSFFSHKEFFIKCFNSEIFSSRYPSRNIIINRISALRHWSSPVIFKPFFLALLTIVFLCSRLLIKKDKIIQLSAFLILSILSYDLISFGSGYNTTVKPDIIYNKTPGINYLLNQEKPFRVLQDFGRGLYINTLIPFEIQEVGGYSSVYPDRTNKLLSFAKYGLEVLNGRVFDRWVSFSNPNSPIFDLMNVKYFLTSPFVNLKSEKLKLVFRKDLSIYENKNVMPRAYGVHHFIVKKKLEEILRYMASPSFQIRKEVILEEEPAKDFVESTFPISKEPKVTIDRYDNDEVVVKTDFSANGWLVLSDTYYPGWKALVDGEEEYIRRANFNFRAVPLSAGKHTVIFKFQPPSVRLGSALTFLGYLISLTGIFFCFLYHNRKTIKSICKKTGKKPN